MCFCDFLLAFWLYWHILCLIGVILTFYEKFWVCSSGFFMSKGVLFRVEIDYNNNKNNNINNSNNDENIHICGCQKKQ